MSIKLAYSIETSMPFNQLYQFEIAHFGELLQNNADGMKPRKGEVEFKQSGNQHEHVRGI
jgi:hypothetical protein